MAAATESGRPRRPSSAPVFWGAPALFAVLFALLAYQLAASTPPPPRPVLVRKVIKRRIVTTVVPTPGATTVSGGGTTVSSSAPEPASGEVAPVTTGAS
jgi:hypothetical protein